MWNLAGAPVASAATPAASAATPAASAATPHDIPDALPEKDLDVDSSPRPAADNLTVQQSSSVVSDPVRDSSSAVGSSRASSARTGRVIAGNSDAATPLTRKTEKVDLHGMHKRFVRAQSARSTPAGAEGAERVSARPATQGGNSVVGHSLRRTASPASQLSGGAVATGVASAQRSAHSLQARDAAATSAAAEEEALSAWRASFDSWEGDDGDQQAGEHTGRPGRVGKRGERQRREPASRRTPAGSRVASHRMVLAAATAAQKRREDKASNI